MRVIQPVQSVATFNQSQCHRPVRSVNAVAEVIALIPTHKLSSAFMLAGGGSHSQARACTDVCGFILARKQGPESCSMFILVHATSSLDPSIHNGKTY